MNIEPWRALDQGDTGDAVRGMQHLLREHGSAIAADGTFGPLTAAAVKEFQAGLGLPESGSGTVGPHTWGSLVVATGAGATGEAVMGVQSFGLTMIPESEPLVVDGDYGPVTEERVRMFQGLWGLTVDGIAGRQTWSYLGADKRTAWPLVQPGDTGYRVLPVQHLLRAHGFEIAADGIYGPLTGEAVRQFDAAHRAVFVSDVAGNLTWPSLVIQVGPGDDGEAVQALQSVFPVLAVDGIFGPMTEAAVVDFQEMFGLAVDGIAGQETWHALMVPKSE